MDYKSIINLDTMLKTIGEFQFFFEAKGRKAMVKRRELSLADYSTWLAQQQNEADRLMDELTA